MAFRWPQKSNIEIRCLCELVCPANSNTSVLCSASALLRLIWIVPMFQSCMLMRQNDKTDEVTSHICFCTDRHKYLDLTATLPDSMQRNPTSARNAKARRTFRSSLAVLLLIYSLTLWRYARHLYSLVSSADLEKRDSKYYASKS